jgi:hypothetical protein
MPSPEPTFSAEARLLLRLGLGLGLTAALASWWELLSLQPPDSPLHWGVLVGPITQLREVAFAHGTLAVLLALAWSRLYGAGEARWLAWLLAFASLLHVLVLGYAAGRGLLAVQLLDPRADARIALYTRGFAHVLASFGLTVVFVRALRAIR